MSNGQLRLIDRLGSWLADRRFVPVVAALGLLVRLALIAITAKHPFVFADELDYQAIAVSLWKTHQYSMYGASTAFRPPAEPFLIAAVYRLAGQIPILIKLIEALLLTAVPFLCARLGRQLGLSPEVSNLGALLVSFHPGLDYASTTFYPTALTTVALTYGLLYSATAVSHNISHKIRSNMSKDAARAGLALALAGLATTTFVPLPFLIALYCAWRRKLQVALIIAIVGLLPSVLWVARNRITLGQATVATNGGLNLYIGANYQATPLSGNWITLPPDDPGVGPRDEIAQDHMWQKRARFWIERHPLHYAWLCVSRGLLVVDSVGRPKTEGLHSGLAPQIIGWCMLPFVLASIAGLLLYRRTALACFTAAALFLVIVSSAMTLVKPRFRFPCDPTLAIFAVAVIPRLRGTIRPAEQRRQSSSSSMHANVS